MHVSRRIVALVFAFVAALPFACNASAPALAPEGAIAIPDVSPARSALADASARVVDDTPPSVSDASPDDAGASAKGPSYGDPEPSFGGGGPDLDSNSIALGGDGGDRIGFGPRDAGANVIKMRVGPFEIKGHLPPDVVQRFVRQSFGRFRVCYQTARKTKPKLAGRITVRFVIERTGAVSSSRNEGSTLGDAVMIQCVVREFARLDFPRPEDGADVTVKYSVDFSVD